MMCSIRPSSRGLFSVLAMSCVASTILLSIFQPSSVCAISRPLKRTVTFALCPSSRKRRTCFSLKSKSCFSVLGPILTSLTWIVVCFLRASLSRRACVYLYLPKSMIRHTGGWASGATSTRSNSCWRAVSRAWAIGMMPSCSPLALTTRTSRTRMPSLIRMSLAWLIGVLLVSWSARGRPPRGWGPAGRGTTQLRKGLRPTGRSRAAHGETGLARGDLAGEIGEDAVDGHSAEIIARAVAEAHGPVLGLPRADHQHVGHLAHLRVADAVAELLVAVVELGAQARGPQPPVHRACVLDVLLADREHARLHRRQPRRKRAGVVLDEHPDEALERAQDRAVHHDRALGLPVAVDVLEPEAVRLLEVDLDRRVLPPAPERVLDVHVDLRPVEGAVARVQLERQAIGA